MLGGETEGFLELALKVNGERIAGREELVLQDACL
jgi:hypothetical protein